MVLMHWQEAVVILLLVLCAGLILRKIYLFFKATGKQINPCEGCISGCELRDLYEKKRQNCTRQKGTEKEKAVASMKKNKQ